MLDLPIANEIAIIIFDKYIKVGFQNIIFACQYIKNKILIFQNISSNIIVYILLYNILFFLCKNLEWY